jgi:hypothetical protein
MLWLLVDRWLGAKVAAAAAAVEGYKPPEQTATTSPGPAATLQDGFEEMAAVWSRCSQLMHALCASSGTRYFHFLQPNQYVPGSKPIGDEERRVAIDQGHPWASAIERGYPLLEKRFPELRARGVAFGDLRGIFREHPEPLWADTCCHLSPTGYEIVARVVAGAIRQHLDFEGVEVAGLRTEPAVLQIADPTRAEPVRVLARRRDGSEIDITGMPATEMLAEDATIVAVDAATGSLRALRRGQTTLRISCRGSETATAVRCDWPALVTGNDSVAGPDGRVPVLTGFDPGSVTAGTTLQLRVDGCPAGTLGVLLVSPELIPPALPTGLDGRIVLPLLPVDGTATATYSLPAAAVVRACPLLFFRVLFADIQQRRIVATSRPVVVTFD